MSYFYSESITYCECIMPREIGWQVMNELGELECVQFEHREVNYDNPCSKSLKRCDEAIAKVNQIKKFIHQMQPKFKVKPASSHKQLLGEFNKEIARQKIHGHLYINEIEDEIRNVHAYFTRQKQQLEQLNKNIRDKVTVLAMISTLNHSEDFKVISRQKVMFDSASLFDYKCVVVNRKDQSIIQKGLFRISRGNCWAKMLEIDISLIKSSHMHDYKFLADKIVCIIVFQFGENNTLLNKINRFISCMDATAIGIPMQRWEQVAKDYQAQLAQIHNLQSLITDAVERYLHRLYQPFNESQFSLLTYLQAYALKQREVYRKLASTNESKNFLHFNLYIPTKELPLKLNLNQKLPPLTLTPKQPPQQPPSKFATNELIEIPQEIVNTYGVPSHGEFNPAVLYIVSFGFFIGVMFGDVGHMLMAIPFLIYFKVNVWAWTVVFFMGYCGLIYNQFFGLNLGLFSSCYGVGSDGKVIRQEDCVYAFGIDSMWKRSYNQMQFTNSLKMKVAVILGVTHMLLGTCIRISNCIKKKNWLGLCTVAIPQLVFMVCTFFYMDAMIVIKWMQDYAGEKSSQAPSIIATMISVYAGFGDSSLVFWANERKFEKFLVITAYCMIPIMLFGVPLGTYIKRKKASVASAVNSDRQLGFNQLIDEKVHHDPNEIQSKSGSEDGITERNPGSASSLYNKKDKQHSDDHHNEPLQQIFVHSFIEAIQYILGTVSNTASYLRLWALSLAHAQLSEVIYDLILKKSVAGGYSHIIPAFLTFIAFYFVTFGVLICMDSMECFLHSLRLHWVEFQNKFYEGKGYKFVPFDFRAILVKQ